MTATASFELPASITPLHVERGRQMRKIVKSDVVQKGLSFEQAVDQLAEYLGIQSASVKLGIAIANEADLGRIAC